METNKYKALLKAVELGSITAAAQELGYSPSGLTRLLDGLEKDLGFPVLTRGPQGVGFTHEGEELLPVFRELLHWQGRLNEYCAAIRGLEQGELFVGSYYSIAARWLPTILQKFQRDYPGIRIHVQEAGNSRLLEGLQERRLSCVLFSRPQNYSGEWLPLYSDRYVAWIPESFPQARQAAISPEEIAQLPFIEPFPHQGTTIEAFFKKYHIQPDVRFTTSDMYTCWCLVEAGLGVSMDNELSSSRWQGRVKVLPFTTGEKLELGIALPSYRDASPALKKFIEYVQNFVAEVKANERTAGKVQQK